MLSTTRTIKTNNTLQVTNTDLIAALNRANPDLKIPDGARVYVSIPGGGDYSSMNLDIDGDCPITVSWETVETD